MKNRRDIFSDAVLLAVAENQSPTSFLVHLRGDSPGATPDGVILEPFFCVGGIHICKVSSSRTISLLRWILQQNDVEHVDLDFEINLLDGGEPE